MFFGALIRSNHVVGMDEHLQRVVDDAGVDWAEPLPELPPPHATICSALSADGSDHRRFFPTGQASPQMYLPVLDETYWHPARRLAPFHPPRHLDDDSGQSLLFSLAPEIALG